MPHPTRTRMAVPMNSLRVIEWSISSVDTHDVYHQTRSGSTVS